ncbi:MAG: ATP-dependent DNA ligase [Actinomycetota bacterium]|nr:ATP-dependent DNA ligase [Actinomycetota bacterium]
MPTKYEFVEADGQEVRISNPDKVFFPQPGLTKMDLVQYYLAVGPGALRGCLDRPVVMYRWPNGVGHPDDAFYQKRVLDKGRPPWLQSVLVRFPSGRSADMLAGADLAHLIWAINMGCIDLNPWPVRRDDVDHPDELRVDLDPTPGIPYSDVRRAAALVKETLDDFALVGYPKTSGKRGLHVYIRIERNWSFTEVRRAALALAREVARRGQGLATTAWWKEERIGVFVDYNQNARDRTIASAYSARPTADARVSCPVAWDEIAELEPEAFTVETVPERFASVDPSATIDDVAFSLDPLLQLARKDEEGGLGDAPWPPHFPKQKDEPARVQPSKRRKA